MDITFEGDLIALTPKTEDFCREILKQKGFTNCAVQVEAVGKKGDNYVANVKRFIAQQDGVNNGLVFKMVAKLAPTQKQVRDMIGTDIAFSNEIVVYEHLFPKYDELQENANVPEENRLKHPICYGTSTELPSEIILLEDIKETGFGLLDRFKSMNDEQVRISLKELAKFHALSFVVKTKESEFLELMKVKLVNLWVRNGMSDEMEKYLSASEQETQDTLKNEEHKKRVKGLVKNMIKAAAALHENDINSEYATIVQGDCWTNNMMYKIKDGKPVDIRMLDFQITRIATPATDILYFILNCTDYEARYKNFYNWLDYYYECLTDFLKYFDMEAVEVYPREQFDVDLKRNGKAAFSMGVMISNMIVREPEDIIDFREADAFASPDAFSVNEMRDVIHERYNKRLEGLIKTCIEFDYI